MYHFQWETTQLDMIVWINFQLEIKSYTNIKVKQIL